MEENPGRLPAASPEELLDRQLAFFAKLLRVHAETLLGGYLALCEDLLIMRRQIPKGMEVVLVSYVDLDKAKCPPAADVVKFAKRFRYAAVLFDTCNKDGKTFTFVDCNPPRQFKGCKMVELQK